MNRTRKKGKIFFSFVFMFGLSIYSQLHPAAGYICLMQCFVTIFFLFLIHKRKICL